MNSRDTLKITLGLSIGEGRIYSQSSCLIRPLLKLVRTGKPIGKINYIFYHHVDGKYYNLGSLCRSEGRRILFFPGFQLRNLLWLSNVKSGFKKFSLPDFFIDHFTLERNLKKVHWTLLKKGKAHDKKYPAFFLTHILNKNLIFWFGLGVQDPSFLEETARETVFYFTSPPSDAERQIKNIEDARKEAVFHIVEHVDKSRFSENDFIHFNFFICPKDYKIPEEHVFLSLPTKEPLVSNFHSPSLIPYRIHYVSIPGFDRTISVLVSRHKGILKNKTLTAMYSGKL